MVETMTAEQRAMARAMLDSGKIEEVYQFIAGFGHRYARLASGVAVGNMFSGLTALEFLEETAKDHGVPVDDAKIQAVRAGMARGLLDMLDQIANAAGDVVREITADEAWTFHNRIFTELNLPVDSWTLNTPFKLLDEQERAAIWDSMLDSNGRLPWDTKAGIELLVEVVKNAEHDPQGAGTWFLRLGANEDVYSAWLARLSTEILEDGSGWVARPLDPFLFFTGALMLDAQDGEFNKDQIREFLNALPEVLKLSVKQGSGLTAYGSLQGDAIDGTDEADVLFGQDGADVLSGLAGNDVIDGGTGNDTLNGGAGNDALFGGAGNDTLDGGTGSDQLHGGLGFDTYTIGTGLAGDLDTIVDTDGNGTVIINGNGAWANGLIATSATTWESADGQIKVSHSVANGSKLIIRSGTDTGSVMVDGWSQGHLGITLPEFKPGQGGTGGTGLADFLNPLVNSVPSAAVNLSGGNGRDMIWGTAFGSGDTLDGGEGSDIINGRGGADIITGGVGHDFISGLGSGTIAHGGEGNDVLNAQWNFGFDVRTNSRVPITESGIWRDVEAFFSWSAMQRLGRRDDGSLAIGFDYGLSGMFDFSGASVAPGWTFRFRRLDNDTYTLVYSSATEPDGIALGQGRITTEGGSGITYTSGVSLFGEDGNDQLGGSSAADYLDGGDGDDAISGEGGHDVILAGAGNDQVAGGDGNDSIDGGAGNDEMWGEGGNDLIDGGDGDDLIWGDYYPQSGIVGGGNDILRGGAGNDQLSGQAGDDLLSGGIGNDLLVGGTGNDRLMGEDGDDELQGEDGDDTLDGGNGADRLFGQDGNDVLLGGEGADHLEGGDGNDHLDGGAGKDVLIGGEGDDTLMGGEGDDELWGGTGKDTLSGGEGADTLRGEAGDDVLAGGAGNDMLMGGDGRDTLDGGDGDDELQGGAGNDSLNGGNGADRLFGEDGNDSLYGGAGDDVLAGDGGAGSSGAAGNDYLDGGAGNDVLFGQGGHDELNGGAGDDRLYGDEDNGPGGNDTLRGGAGNDLLSGGAGDDILDGGTGNDVLYGGTGNNQYHFEAGFGIDHVYLQEGNPGSDRITFGSSINQADLHYEAYGLDLIIRHINGADTVVVHNYFASTGAGGIAVGGTDVTDRGRLEEQLELPSLVFGTGGDDSMLGTSGDDSLYGADGNDTLMGLEGNDRLFGGGGDDLLIGGFGHDVLDGGAGNDIYHYDFGHGYDRIINLGSAEAGTDIIRIGPGLTRAMINNVQISGDDLMLAFFTGAGFQSLSLDGFLAGSNRSHIIEFDDGTWMSAEDFVETARSWNGTDGDDTYTATDEGNNLRAGAGNDIVHGQGGNDRIFGGEGDDQLFGGDGNDVIYGDGGADVLDGGAGDDMLYANEFGDGSPDILRGGAGNDRYYISTGYQYGSSPDTVIELEGEGVDTVFAESFSYTLTANVENLVGVFNSSTWHWQNPSYPGWIVHIPRSLVGNDLDNIIQFGKPSYMGSHSGRYYVLDGGAGNDTLIGTEANETYVVDSLGDVIIEGDWGSDNRFSIDTVRASLSYSIANLVNIENLELVGSGDWAGWGNAGNNTLNGRTSMGANHLYGGMGDDRYIISANDTVVELAGEGNDTVVIDAIEDGAPQNQWFDVANFANIENLELGNNLVPDGRGAGTINGGAFHANLRGDAGDNVLTGNGFSNEIRGGGGNDTLKGGDREPNTVYKASRDYLYGEEGNDLLIAGQGGADLHGGTGDDVLRGGYGDDDFHYGIGDGRDTVDSWAGAGRDRVVFGAGIDPDHVTFSRSGLDLIVQVGSDPNDQLTVSSYWYEEGDRLVVRGVIDHFLFADGTVRRGDLHQLPYTNKPPVTLIPFVEFEAIGETAFSAKIPSGMFQDEAQDTLTYSLSENAPAWLVIDPLTGELTGTPPNGGADLSLDIIAADSWGQRTTAWLTVNVRNVLRGTDGADVLAGTQFRDDLHGGAGNDVLSGAGAGDRLYGGEGDDIYVVSDPSQQVIELAGGGDDTVRSGSHRYVLGENVERLELLDGAYEGTGNQGNNTLIGNQGDNRLDGAAGEDRLVGGGGDDTYVVDSAGDVVIEVAGEGIDTVESALDWQLGDHLENLVLTGSGNLSGVGNSLDNELYGNDGNNRLEGGLGADRLYGGLGDDLYIIESAQDRVFEDEGGGLDTIERRFETNLILADNVENLILANGIVSGNGNALDNVINGNAAANKLSGMDGNDTLVGGDGDDQLWGGSGDDVLRGDNGADYLDGGSGADQMSGGAGNDIYIVDNTADTIIELAGGGTDQVQSSASYTLSADLENLFLTGSADINGTGNALGNYLAGNSGSNTLNGGGGNDTLSGGGGNDTLLGGAGNDAYLVDANSGSDVVDNTGGGNDTVFFQNGVTRERLSFSREGDDLLIRIDQAATPAVRVRNHFLGGDWAIDQVQPDGGSSLSAAQINQLVSGGSGGGFDKTITGTSAGEQLVGTAGKDLIEGLGGDDTLFGMAGDDTLRGGDGNDQLAGGNGSAAGSGNDRLEGGAGNDTLRGQDGNNVLVGGSGDDQYIHGGGNDVIDNTGGGVDWLFFQNGITTGQLAFTREGDNLVIVVNGNANQRVTVTNHFLGGDWALDYLQAATGNALNTAAINALVSNGGGDGGGTPGAGNDADYPSKINGTANAEQLVGTSGRDLIKGLAGDDKLFGMGGDDKLEGGDGNDYLSGGNGSFSGSGKDILIGGAGDDQLVGEDGDDMLIGGVGNDTYFYRAGSGADTVDNTGGGTDWLYFDGIDRSRLSYHRDGDDLVVRVDGSAGQQMRVLRHFQGGQYAIAFVQPGDGGYAITADQIASQLTPMTALRTSMTSDAAPAPEGMSLEAELQHLVGAMGAFRAGAATGLVGDVPVQLADVDPSLWAGALHRQEARATLVPG